jgi:hypothetical protein
MIRPGPLISPRQGFRDEAGRAPTGNPVPDLRTDLAAPKSALARAVPGPDRPAFVLKDHQHRGTPRQRRRSEQTTSVA